MDEQNFNVYSWSSGIPLCDDVWLGMQLRNIAIVDFGFIRPIEREAIARFVANDKIGMDVLIPLSAISQMWVFSLYEFLRTWRQRADLIIKVSDKYDALPDRDRAEYLAAEVAKAEGRESFVKRAPTFVSEQVGCISQAGFADGVRAYKEHTEGLFRSIRSFELRSQSMRCQRPKASLRKPPDTDESTCSLGQCTGTLQRRKATSIVSIAVKLQMHFTGYRLNMPTSKMTISPRHDRGLFRASTAQGADGYKESLRDSRCG